MLIKVSQHNEPDQFFIGIPDHDDTKGDGDITKIYCRVWTINTGNQMLDAIYSKNIQ